MSYLAKTVLDTSAHGRIGGLSSPSIDVLLYSTNVAISVCKLLMIIVSGKLWWQILNDYWFWNIALEASLRSWPSLINLWRKTTGIPKPVCAAVLTDKRKRSVLYTHILILTYLRFFGRRPSIFFYSEARICQKVAASKMHILSRNHSRIN